MDFPFEQIENEGRLIRTFFPDVEDEGFGSFIESESNLNKLIDSWSK